VPLHPASEHRQESLWEGLPQDFCVEIFGSLVESTVDSSNVSVAFRPRGGQEGLVDESKPLVTRGRHRLLRGASASEEQNDGNPRRLDDLLLPPQTSTFSFRLVPAVSPVYRCRYSNDFGQLL
jgi:hypothetical protein